MCGKMKATNEPKTPEVNSNNSFDAHCQGFEGGSFYGLDYIIVNFVQNTKIKPSIPVRPA